MASRFGLDWDQPLGRPECPYARRWVLRFGIGSIRLHRWYRSDDKRYMHDHPWWFLTFVISGGYTDVSRIKSNRVAQFSQAKPEVEKDSENRDHVGRFSVRYRPARHAHYVTPNEGGATTILITGPEIHRWGFWVDGRKKAIRSYFWKYGHPPCDEP